MIWLTLQVSFCLYSLCTHSFDGHIMFPKWDNFIVFRTGAADEFAQQVFSALISED
jgi:hypothetical protein